MRDSLLASAVELLSRDFREVAGGVPEVPTAFDEPTHINLESFDTHGGACSLKKWKPDVEV